MFLTLKSGEELSGKLPRSTLKKCMNANLGNDYLISK
jgi:hypothetical protein